MHAHRFAGIVAALTIAAAAAAASPAEAAGQRSHPMFESQRADAERITDRTGDRRALSRALRQIQRRHGGRKIGQRWQGDTLLVAWIDGDGNRQLFRIDSRTGHWDRD